MGPSCNSPQYTKAIALPNNITKLAMKQIIHSDPGEMIAFWTILITHQLSRKDSNLAISETNDIRAYITKSVSIDVLSLNTI